MIGITIRLGIGSGNGIGITLCRGYASLYTRPFAEYHTFDDANLMHFLLVRRMFQVLLYDGCMRHFLDAFYQIMHVVRVYIYTDIYVSI